MKRTVKAWAVVTKKGRLIATRQDKKIIEYIWGKLSWCKIIPCLITYPVPGKRRGKRA